MTYLYPRRMSLADVAQLCIEAFAPSIRSVLQSLSNYGTEALEVLANHAREAAKNNGDFNIDNLDTKKYSNIGGRRTERIVFTAVAQFLNSSPTIAQSVTAATGPAPGNIKVRALAFLFDAVLTELATRKKEHNEADDNILEIINHALGGNIRLH
ncbi:hypothetical protein Ddc_14649 [Ditylenchus destructor]|nr:hypothetical protein Ddc_14649 [Ditylenchus destructor]